jgi:hypothetical protein
MGLQESEQFEKSEFERKKSGEFERTSPTDSEPKVSESAARISCVVRRAPSLRPPLPSHEMLSKNDDFGL